MISNQILQGTIDGLKEIARVDFSVLDAEGKEIATTLKEPRSFRDEAASFAKSAADSQEIKGCQYFKIFDDNFVEYILVSMGEGEDAYLIGKMASFQIQNLIVAYKERFDKDNFIKNLLLDNLLLVDIYSRAKKLHIEVDVPRVVMILECDNPKDINVLETVRSFFGTNNDDYVTAVDEKDVLIIKDLSEGTSKFDIDRAAMALQKALEKEGIRGIKIAYGTTVSELREVSRSYKEAKMAMDVGRIFFEERNIVAYEELGIGRLIYQLPLPLCKMFIKEIFGDKSPASLDDETLTTIYKFFENSLNVSETSRQLFIHRNTLVYRLDKILKLTGLDLRTFDDAITFHIALMVVKYMKYMESFDY